MSIVVGGYLHDATHFAGVRAVGVGVAGADVQFEARLRVVGLVAQVARVTQLQPLGAVVACHVHRQAAAEGEATGAHAAPNNYKALSTQYNICIKIWIQQRINADFLLRLLEKV